MKQKLLKLASKLFLKSSVLGNVAKLATSAIVSYLMSLLPNLPEIATKLVAMAMKLPKGIELTPGALAAALFPVIYGALVTVIQEFITSENNETLKTLKGEGVYSGDLDGWVGPDARLGIATLVDAANTKTQEFPDRTL